MIVGWHKCIALWSYTMQDQKSLTLCCSSFLGGGSDIVNPIFAHGGGQHFGSSLILLHSSFIIRDARATIVDTPLMLIRKR